MGGGVDGGASAEEGWWGDGGGKRTVDSADRRWVGFWKLGLCCTVMCCDGWDGDTTVRWSGGEQQSSMEILRSGWTSEGCDGMGWHSTDEKRRIL